MRTMSTPNAFTKIVAPIRQTYNHLTTNSMEFWRKNKAVITGTVLCVTDIFSGFRMPTLFFTTLYFSLFTPNVIDKLVEKIKSLWNSHCLNKPVVVAGTFTVCYLVPEKTFVIASAYCTMQTLKQLF